MCGCLEFDLIWFDFVLRCILSDFVCRSQRTVQFAALSSHRRWDDEKVNEKKRREPVTKIEDYGISKISKIK